MKMESKQTITANTSILDIIGSWNPRDFHVAWGDAASTGCCTESQKVQEGRRFLSGHCLAKLAIYGKIFLEEMFSYMHRCERGGVESTRLTHPWKCWNSFGNFQHHRHYQELSFPLPISLSVLWYGQNLVFWLPKKAKLEACLTPFLALEKS